MDFENKKVLGVHIEGEKKFSMYKQWGEELNSQLYKDRAEYHRQCLQFAGYDIQACG